ncbi:iron reductase [Caballeronia calidae]|uniref:Iron reductase n=1 Tax=Caballeronia calidae TaxID=1777139 RepID=A0A158DFG6_9BURK|nr:siderophore-iron reductase FhuF [Caballeronia calidae]SAK93382.1 iron reductase [Caballeronia calidae]
MMHRARSFAEFAPAALAPYLQNVWLGTPCESFGDDTLCIPLTSLHAHRDVLLAAMTALYGGDAGLHARALLSQWSKYYFGLAAPAGVAAARLLGRPLDMSPERTWLVLKEGMPAALHFDADALRAPAADPALRYAGLIAHLDSVIGMIAGMTKIAPRVLWSNAGNLLDYLLASCPSNVSDEDIDAEWLFRPDDANPLRTPIRDTTPRSPLLPSPFRARRVCCVRYEIPGETQLCASCPLLLTMRDDELALQDAIR